MIIEVKDTDVNVVNGELHIKITADIEKLLKKKVRLETLNVGDVFEIGNTEYILLENTSNGAKCITKELLDDRKTFDSNKNNWINSSIRKYLNNEYLSKLEKEIGNENIIEHDVDLTSNDGLKDYGVCSDKISILTCDMYRKYRNLLNKIDSWWWTLTPWSTESAGYSRGVCYVGSGGALGGRDCGCAGGVRPFCIFNPSIFVSCK